MKTPAELREDSHLYVLASQKEDTLVLRQMLAKHAFALAQLAEKLERDQADRQASEMPTAPLRPYGQWPRTPQGR